MQKKYVHHDMNLQIFDVYKYLFMFNYLTVQASFEICSSNVY